MLAETLGNGMELTKEQFWKALSEPVEKSCSNCKYSNLGAQGGISRCGRTDIDRTEQIACYNFMSKRYWEWDEKTY